MRASGQPTLPVVGLQQLNDFAESYSAANLDLKVANTRRSQLSKLVAESSAQRSREEDDAPPGTAAPHTKRTGLVEKLWSTSPPPTQKTVSWGSEHVH